MNYLQVDEHKLSNGMSVWLNEDNSQPRVFGAIVVKAGAKDCPNTGIAHYFEHMMFKGTDKIGTLDYESEKVILDIIAEKYDMLAHTTDPKKRNHLLKIINDLSIKAADYVVPNEFDHLITRFGGTRLNAGTSYDYTTYFNIFSPEYMEQWAELNSERLINPVFRLFQNELETVYEEKNMQNDKLGSLAIEKVTERFFYPHPYAYPIIGSTENLKNPSLKAMRKFFEDYYVASNMGLILSGDFKSEEVLPVLEKSFSRIRTGSIPDERVAPPPPFKGRETSQIKYMVPLLRIMAMGFRGVPANHPDKIALNIAVGLLNNSNGTGLLDKLTVEHKVVATMAVNESMNDTGILGVLAMPRLFFQSYGSVEKLVWQQIDRVKSGDFSDELFQSLKLEERRDYQTSLEEISDRAQQMIRIFSQGKHWQDYLDEVARIEQLTKEDVMDVAQRYFGKDYLFVTKKNGNYPKEVLPKPSYSPIIPKHTGENSPYVEKLLQIPVRRRQPRFIDFKKDVLCTQITPLVKLYSNINPVNDIFTLDLYFGVGCIEQPLLMQLAGYLSFLTVKGLSFEQFHQKLQTLGSVINFGCTDSDFKIMVTGFDDHFEETLELIGEFMRNVESDEKKLSHIMDETKVMTKTFIRSNDSLARALSEKTLYGDQSRYLAMQSYRQLKKIKGQNLIDLFHHVLSVECILCYTGRLNISRVKESVERILPFGDVQCVSKSPYVRPFQTKEEPTVFFLHLPTVNQSIIKGFILSDLLPDRSTRGVSLMFSHYFGGSMQSLMFQELREFRSYAYQAASRFTLPPLSRKDRPGCFTMSLATQSDKTIDALEVLSHLIEEMPLQEERLNAVKQSISNRIGTDYPSFRSLPQKVASYVLQGLDSDPSELLQQVSENLTIEDLRAFYLHHIHAHPVNYAIVGNETQIDMKKLEQFGKVVRLSIKDIYNV